MRERLVSTGASADRIEWRPTYAEDAGAVDMPPAGGVAFVGRLEQAKGIELLLTAWTPAVARRWGRLVIAGDGPLAGLVSARATSDPTVQWRGRLDHGRIRTVLRESQVIALPSLWYEGFPRVAAEAMSIGRPLLASSDAGFSCLCDNGAGWRVDSTPEAWAGQLLSLDDAALRAASASARAFYERRCSPTVALRQLQNVYVSVVAEMRTR